MKSHINTGIEGFLQFHPEINIENERKFRHIFHPSSFVNCKNPNENKEVKDDNEE